MPNDRIRYWKERFRACFLAGDRKGIAEAERQLENWRKFEANEAEALAQIEKEELERRRQAV